MSELVPLTVGLAYTVLLVELRLLPIPSEASAASLWLRAGGRLRRALGAVAALPALLLFLAPPVALLVEYLTELQLLHSFDLGNGAGLPGKLSEGAVSTGVVPVGLGLVWLGTMLHLWATVVFRHRVRQAAESLVQTGPFAVSRNPIAFGLMLCALGWGILLQPPVALPMAIYTVLYLDRKVRIEEQAVAARYGAAYSHYAATVGRYLGRLASRSR